MLGERRRRRARWTIRNERKGKGPKEDASDEEIVSNSIVQKHGTTEKEKKDKPNRKAKAKE